MINIFYNTAKGVVNKNYKEIFSNCSIKESQISKKRGKK